ncbi:unnamed protein product [Mytilus coruscus]|uniref:DNA helicase n=1 Tax=Mytilus coruscus TaxID=42192 RepID=A0A6J8CDC8_MYTCO|nr:unnamed protein product [Mytilus coruscus]
MWQDSFTLYELVTVMRQQEDGEFANLLNCLREGLQSESDITVLQSMVVEFETDIIKEYQHLYTARAEVDQFNNEIFELSTTKNAYIESIDLVTGDVDITLQKTILEKIPQNDPSKTMGLQTIMKIAENLNADICTNISIEDGLTNGASCCIKLLDYRVEGSKRCSIIWVLFDDVNIGMQQRQKYSYLRNTKVEPSWTPIFEITRKFKVGHSSGYHIIRRQFPLRLSATKTIHKSQGSTLNNVVVNFSN